MANDEMRQNWTDGAAGWVAMDSILDAVSVPVTTEIVRAAGFEPGQRVLDVGCGSGTLMKDAIDAGADVVGVDISDGMIAAAGERVPTATAVVADAQTADLAALCGGARFDRAVSRYGVMFFDDPVAAFANIRSAVAPRGRMAFACWRTRDENPMFTLGMDTLGQRLDAPTPTPTPHAPGPTALADRTRTESILADAGWTSIDVEPFDFECNYGFDGSDGVENRLSMILGTTIGRLARQQLEPELGPDGWSALLDDVRAELRARRVDGVIRFPAATWLVTAAA